MRLAGISPGCQLMQVGGRSGRADLPGEVLIQTDYPDHALYQALEDGDYGRFARIPHVAPHQRLVAGAPAGVAARIAGLKNTK